MDQFEQIVILISSDTEWKCVRRITPLAEVSKSPFGEMISTELSNKKVLFFQSGWGKVTAAATTQYVIDHYHPSLLINLGTCGGFLGCVEVGEVILVRETIIYDIIEQMSDPQEAIDFYTTSIDLAWLPNNAFAGAVRDKIVSADRDVLSAEIPQLIERFDARVGDWESGAIAWVAGRMGQRLLILRGVSDLVGEGGGEVYENMERYEIRTTSVMEKLIGMVEKFLIN
jgi:adenosylhomocysteine nucleosidase